MKVNLLISKGILYFSRWCGKGYAIFAALGKEVHISGLAIHICLCSLQKSARKGVIVTRAACWEAAAGKAKNSKQQKEEVYSCLKEGEVCPDGWKYIKYRRGYVLAYPLF